MEFLSLSRRHSSARNVPNGEERGETDVFAGYHRLIIWIILMSLTVGEKTWHQWKVRMSYNSNKPVFDEEADESSDIKAAGSWTPPPPPPPLLVDTAGVFAGTWVVPFCEKKSAQSIPNGTATGSKGVNCDFDWRERTSPERIWKALLSERDRKCREENYSRCCSSTYRSRFPRALDNISPGLQHDRMTVWWVEREQASYLAIEWPRRKSLLSRAAIAWLLATPPKGELARRL